MESRLRFTLGALVWALILMAVYALTTRSQTNTTAKQPAATKGQAAQSSGISPAAAGAATPGQLAKFASDGTALVNSTVNETKAGDIGVSDHPGIEAHRAGDD